MTVRTYADATAFLAAAGAELEKNEAANSLMLGICERLRTNPEWMQQSPFLATVSRGEELVLGVMMTPPQNFVLAVLGDGAPAALPSLVTTLRAGGWRVPGVLGPTEVARPFAEAWVAEAGGSYSLGMAQRVHELRAVAVPEGTVPGQLRVATGADRALVTEWARGFYRDALGEEDLAQIQLLVKRRVGVGDIVIWEDGAPVSMAMRTRPAGRGISVSLVYTPPEQRRKGYATACVAALSRQLLAEGYDYCALFTDLANPTSNDIYTQIGYRPVADFDEYRFTD
jgi:uncharacterized protein